MVFQRLRSLVFGRKTPEEPAVILSGCKKPGTLERWVMWMLSHGVQPQHVVIVLDSTQDDFRRRVSSTDIVEADMNIAWRVLSLAARLGCREITAQLLQRFPPRNRDDMQAIYRALKETLKSCLEFGNELDKQGVRVRAYGDTQKLPEDIQRLIARIETRTEQNQGLLAGVTLGNAMKHDVSVAVADISQALMEGRLRSEDLSHEFMESQLNEATPGPADVYIRTSDVSALYAALGSSMPLRVVMRSFVYNLFVKDHLPDLAFWTYAKALLDYQKNHALLQYRRHKQLTSEPPYANILSEGRKREFQRSRALAKHQALNQLALERPLLSIEEAPGQENGTSQPHETVARHLDRAPPSPSTLKRLSLNFRS